MTFSFGKKITQKGHFCSKMDTNLQIRTSLGTKFHLKLAILFSWIKFTKKINISCVKAKKPTSRMNFEESN